MGRKKETPTRYYSKEEKEKIIKEAFDNGVRVTAKKYNISHGMISNWIKSYRENNNTVVENKYKRGNPLAKYSRKKDLTEIEKLEYENMKLRIENERLKKGYMVKGDGTVVVFKK
jgi:transposase-like protein